MSKLQTTVCKGDGVGSKKVPDGEILINDKHPEFKGKDWETQSADFHRAQALAIFEVLKNTLPGGTIDELLIEMLDYRKSRLTVVRA